MIVRRAQVVTATKRCKVSLWQLRGVANGLRAVLYLNLGIAEGTYPAFQEKAMLEVPPSFISEEVPQLPMICLYPSRELYCARGVFASFGAMRGSKADSALCPLDCGEEISMPRRKDAPQRSSDKREGQTMASQPCVRPAYAM